VEQTIDSGSPKRSGGIAESSLGQAWLVLLLAVVFGVALAAVQTQLSGVIAANKLNETLEKVPELVWGAEEAKRKTRQEGDVAITPGTIAVTDGSRSKVYPLFKVEAEGRLAGWVVKAGGQGYADKIELLVGLDPELATITGLFVLEQKETPGLGNKIIFADWRGQFTGKSTAAPLRVHKGRAPSPDAIDAITGATISSRSVTAIVNQVVGGLKGQLTPGTFRPQERR
jgi:electron transport complex protein RnfG